MGDEILVCKQADGIGEMVMTRPEAMNALSLAMRQKMESQFTAWQADDSVRVVILSGAGEKAFSAGMDLKELGAHPEMSIAQNLKAADIVPRMARFTKPIIGAINGLAITGGLELALACDILLAADHARFADTHVRVGLMPTWGLSQKLQRIIGVNRAKEISLTGNFFTAQQACEWGLVNHIMPLADLMPAAHRLAADIASGAHKTVMGYKRLMDEGGRMPFGEAQIYEYETSMAVNEEIKGADVEARREAVRQRGQAQSQK